MLRIGRKRKAVESVSYTEDDNDKEVEHNETDNEDGESQHEDEVQPAEDNVSEEVSNVGDDAEANMEDVEAAADEENVDQPCDRDVSEDDLHTPREEEDNIDVTPRLRAKRKVKRRRLHSEDCPKNPSRKLFGPPKRKKDTCKKDKKSVRPPRHLKEQSQKKKEGFQNRDISEQGVWVKCENSECRKWRFLESETDPANLHPQWTCDMHPDEKFNSCDQPEEDYSELEFIHANFTEGSIVWAKMQSYPWWPAIIEMDPDTDDFMIHGGIDSDVSHYHCVFLDKTVSRSWVPAASVQTFDASGKPPGSLFIKKKDYSKQIIHARERALDALKLSIKDRIQTYGFSKTFKGVWAPIVTDDEPMQGIDDIDVDDEVVVILGSLLSSEDMEELRSQTEDMMPGVVEAVKEMDQQLKGIKKPKGKRSKGKQVEPKQKSRSEKKKKHKKHKSKDGKSRDAKPGKHRRREEKERRKEELLKKMTPEKNGSTSKESINGEGNMVETGNSEAVNEQVEKSEVNKENIDSNENISEMKDDDSTNELKEEEELSDSAKQGDDSAGQEVVNGAGLNSDNPKEEGESNSFKGNQTDIGALMVSEEGQEDNDDDGDKSLNNADEDIKSQNVDKDEISGEVQDQEKDAKDGEKVVPAVKDGDDKLKKGGGPSKAEKDEKRKEQEEKKRIIREEKERRLNEKETNKLLKEQEMKGREEKKKQEMKEREEKKKAMELKKQQREQELKEREEKKKEKEMKKLKDKEKKEQKKKEREEKKAKKGTSGGRKNKKESDGSSSKGQNEDKPPAKKPTFSATKSKPKAFVAPVQVVENKNEGGDDEVEHKGCDGSTQEEDKVIETGKVEIESGVIDKEDGMKTDADADNGDIKVVPNMTGSKLKRKKFRVKKKEVSASTTDPKDPKESTEADEKETTPEVVSEGKGETTNDEKDGDELVERSTDKECSDPPKKKMKDDQAGEEDSVEVVEDEKMAEDVSLKDEKEDSMEVVEDKKMPEDVKGPEKNQILEDEEEKGETMTVDSQPKIVPDQGNDSMNDDGDDDFFDLEWTEAPEKTIASPTKKIVSAMDADSDPFETVEE